MDQANIIVSDAVAAEAQVGGFVNFASKDAVPKYYTPFDHEATYYERVTTPRFSADSDDIFMRSMIEQYALEERNSVTEHDDGTTSGGEPSGKFWMNQSATLAAAKEVLGTHKGLSGKELDAYINTYFAKAWGHFMSTRLDSLRSSRCHNS